MVNKRREKYKMKMHCVYCGEIVSIGEVCMFCSVMN